MVRPIEELISQIHATKSKFIVTTGGVCSSLGKGVLTASMGTLLKNANFSVSVIKWDPYLNVDPGTMSPLVHGEVFVTNDGAETDLDLGHYERILEMHLTKESSVSSGQIFQEILRKEREGVFLGRDIQLVPDVVDAIKQRLLNFALAQKTDFILIEIGGTVGDMEGEIFLEVIRQLSYQLGPQRIMHTHLSYVPFLGWANEMKTKPTQHSVMLLKKSGLMPDALFLRVEKSIDQKLIEKLSLMCGVKKEFIFQVPTVTPIYTLFLQLRDQGVHSKITTHFKIEERKTSLKSWENLLARIKEEKPTVRVALVEKYVGSNDPYISVIEALRSASWACKRTVEVIVIEAERLENNDEAALSLLHSCHGVVIPGGFGKRGVEGKIYAAEWARKNKIPCFGLCLGLHIMLIEWGRNLLGLSAASSMEFIPACKDPLVVLLDSQVKIVNRGGTMRLGAFPCTLVNETKVAQAYGTDLVYERHRHRYEFNNKYKSQLEEKGVVFSGVYKEKGLVEIAELKNHPFMVGVQFHPEFLSTPLIPHPLFKAFVEAIVKK